MHGERGSDPLEPWASARYPRPAVSHEPRIEQLAHDLKGAGLRPFPLPLGIMLDEASPATQRVHPLRDLRRLRLPGAGQGRRPRRVRRAGARSIRTSRC